MEDDKILDKIVNDDGLRFLIYFFIAVAVLVVVVYILNYISVHSAPTQYVSSSYYPLVTYTLFPNTKVYVFYGLNQSNGTACINKAEVLIYTFNYTQQANVLSKQFWVTNRNALIDLLNNNIMADALSGQVGNETQLIQIEQGYTLVCPQSDFQT